MSDVYNAGDVLNKTLIAAVRVPVYRNPGDSQTPFGFVAARSPVGVVYSYLDANPAADRSTLWWVFQPTNGIPYYAKHKSGMYDVSALRQQGVISTEEKVEEEKNQNLPWYEKLIRQYGPWIIVAGLAGTAIRGYLSKPR